MFPGFICRNQQRVCSRTKELLDYLQMPVLSRTEQRRSPESWAAADIGVCLDQ